MGFWDRLNELLGITPDPVGMGDLRTIESLPEVTPVTYTPPVDIAPAWDYMAAGYDVPAQYNVPEPVTFDAPTQWESNLVASMPDFSVDVPGFNPLSLPSESYVPERRAYNSALWQQELMANPGINPDDISTWTPAMQLAHAENEALGGGGLEVDYSRTGGYALPENVNPAFAEAFPSLSRLLGDVTEPARNLFENPWVERAGQSGGEIMTMIDVPDKASTGSKIGDLTADLAGGVMGFMGNPLSAGSTLWNAGETAARTALGRTALSNLPGMAQTGIASAAASVPFELSRMAVNEREFDPAEFGMAIGSNALLDALTHGAVNLGKRKTKAADIAEPVVEETLDTVVDDQLDLRLRPEVNTEVGSTAGSAVDFDVPEVTEARKMLDELRAMDEPVAGQDRIERELENIINGNDLENVPLARRLEAVIDERIASREAGINKRFSEVPEVVEAQKMLDELRSLEVPVDGQAEIENELQHIINGNDLENVPLARRLEAIIDERIAEARKTTSELLGEGSISAAQFTVPEKQADLGEGQKVRSFQVSAAEAPVTDDMVRSGLVTDIYPGGPGAYDTVKLREVDAEAKAMVDENAEKAVQFLNENNEPSALHTATGIRLIEKFQNENNYDRAIDVAESLAEKLTKQGQAISAARLMGALRPDGVLVFAQRQINKINKEPKLKVLGLGKDIKLDPETAENLKRLAELVQNATDENMRIEASQNLQQALNALRPAGLLRKIDAAQTISLLWNVKTQARNILGNEIFYRLERANKYFATPIDWAASKLTGADRTVTFATGSDGLWKQFFTGVKEGGLKGGLKNVAQNNAFLKGLAQGGKAGWKGVNVKGLQTQYELGYGPAFRSGEGAPAAERFLSFFERTLGAVMKGFDTAAYNRAYEQTIGELATLRALKATGKADHATVQKFMAEADANILDIADQYGKYLTFQDDNVISKGLVGIKQFANKMTTGSPDWGAGSVIIKFARTPGALVARGLEYSPAGFLKSAYQIAKPVLTKGMANRREITMSLSRAITGTVGLTGLGYFLADIGIISGSSPKDQDLRELQRQVGEGPYRVNLSALRRWVFSGFSHNVAKAKPGDLIINYDWAQPIAMAISAGANMWQSVQDKKSKVSGLDATIADSMDSALNTVAEQPVLQGITRLFQGYDLGDNVVNALKGIPASFVPTLSSQLRQITDNKSRTTYDPSPIKEAMNMVIAKIPGLNRRLPISYDTFGKPKQTYLNNGNSAFNVFLNPSFVTRYKVTPEAKMVLKTLEETGQTTQIPRVAAKSFKVSGKKFTLTPGEYSRFQHMVGEKTLEGFSKIPHGDDAESQIKAMVKVLNEAGAYGREQILIGRGTKYKKSGNGLSLVFK